MLFDVFIAKRTKNKEARECLLCRFHFIFYYSINACDYLMTKHELLSISYLLLRGAASLSHLYSLHRPAGADNSTHFLSAALKIYH